MDNPNPIPVNSLAFEYVYVANQRCDCGGFFKTNRQQLRGVSSSEPVDCLSALCGKCGAERDFDFDISSFFGQFDEYDRFQQVDDHFREAMLHVRAASFADAESKLRKVIDPQEGEPAFAWAHFHLGMALLMQGRTIEALEHLERALAIQPLEPDIHEGLGRACHEADRKDEAAVHFKECESLKIRFDEPQK